MHEQNERIYYEIINDVSNKLLEEGAQYEIDRDLIYSIQNDWIKNLEAMQSIPVQNKVGSLEMPNESSGNLNSNDSISDDDEYIDVLEGNIEMYMVCFYTKVTRSKHKWKCNFKHGFVNLNNQDIAYNSAVGELIQW